MYRIFIFLCIVNTLSVAQTPNNFAQSKKIAAQIFQTHPQTIYCHCRYMNREVNLASCNMQAAEGKNRSHRIEWEHIMAAEHFGQQFQCWRVALCKDTKGNPYKGRKCCTKIDERFRHTESELYNLWPEVGSVNQARSNYRFGMVTEQSDYLGCAIKIDKKLRRAEPADYAKGVVARAYLFMAYKYAVTLSASQKNCLPHGIGRFLRMIGNGGGQPKSRLLKDMTILTSPNGLIHKWYKWDFRGKFYGVSTSFYKGRFKVGCRSFKKF